MSTTIEKFKFQSMPAVEDGGLIIDSEVRVVVIDGEPWFVAKDVTDVLGHTNGPRAVREFVKDAHKGVTEIVTPGGKQQLTVVDEAGLYSLILRSKVPAAEAFQEWVTAVVLPTIRKTGGMYIKPGSRAELNLLDPAAALETIKAAVAIAEKAQAKLVAAEAEKAVAEAALEEAKPYVEASKEFFEMDGLYSLLDSARKLGVPPRTFNDHLREWGWIDEKGTGAKAYAVRMGYAENRIYIHPGSGAATTQGRLTGKGIERAAIKLDKDGTWRGYANA